ncbi:MAG: dihydrolipoyl dehydrogenase [Candidatus Brocadiae bacterium]|nr:dihydrolipoyl dehydrogenase [Candidatus Brocadiia bacterium]
MKKTDTLVIGSGPGGYVAAIRLAQLGKSVVIAEREDLGGVCLNWGCIPSKALIHAASTLERTRHGAEIGVKADKVTFDMKAFQAFKAGVVSKLTGGVGTLLKSYKVEVLRGQAKFTGPKTAEVAGSRGSETVEFAHCIIATGAKTIEIPGFAFDGKNVIGAKGALALEEVPARMVVIGGGVIGLELGTAYAKLGTKVTVLEALDQLLPGLDPTLVKIVEKGLRKRGVEWHVKAKAKGYKAGGDGLEVEAETEKGALKVACDRILVAVGFRPITDVLDLAKAGVKTNERGFVATDRACRTNVPHIFAIGDVSGPPFLAHKASREGQVAAAVIAGHPEEKDFVTPGAIFTDPEIATVGLSEAEAEKAGIAVKVGKFAFVANGRALSMNETDGFVKVVSDAKNDVLLGVQAVGPEVSNLISEAALAIEMGASAEDLALTVHPHPTLSETIMEAAEAVYGKSIHGVNR